MRDIDATTYARAADWGGGGGLVFAFPQVLPALCGSC